MVAKKRGTHLILKFMVLHVLLLLLLVPFISAKIVITNSFRDMYNLGDTVTVDGYIVAEDTASALASLELQCPGYSKVNSVNLKINKGQKVSFSTLGIQNFILPSDIEGTCDVEALFNGESINSESFTVLNDLLGSFDVSEDTYQLGDTFTLTGIVFKLNGDDVTGDAKVYLKKQGSYAVQLDETKLFAGQVEYSHQLSELEYGTYYVDVKVSDAAGNSQYFENVDSFTIKTDVTVQASSSKYQYEPGEEVVVYGDIETNLADLSNTEVVITLDTLRYTLKPSSDSFEYRFFIPKNMAPGTYTVTVSLQDAFGNAGTDDFLLTVRQVATTLVNDLESDTYDPGDVLSFDIDVLDQSNKKMAADVSVTITDPNGAELYKGIVNSGQHVELEFGSYSAPGTYTVTSQYPAKNLEDTDRVTLNSVVALDSDLEGETLTLKNTGNVPYTERIDFILVATDEDGEKHYYIVPQDVTLEPGKEQTYDLSYEVPDGEYTLLVDDTSTDLSQLEDEQVAEYVDSLESSSENVYSGVALEDDNRPLGKKVDQGFSSITGATTISSYDRSVTPWFLAVIVFIFAGLLCLYAYQQRAVLQQVYVNYKKKLQKKAEDDPLSAVEHKGSYEDGREPGDIPEEDVQKLLAKSTALGTPAPTKQNIGGDENKKVVAMKAMGVKPGTTTLQFHPDQQQMQQKQKPLSVIKSLHTSAAKPTVSKPVLKTQQVIDPVTGKKKNRFSTWTPPSTAGLDEQHFPAKNSVQEKSTVEKDKEKALYEDIDEDFLRDEKF